MRVQVRCGRFPGSRVFPLVHLPGTKPVAFEQTVSAHSREGGPRFGTDSLCQIVTVFPFLCLPPIGREATVETRQLHRMHRGATSMAEILEGRVRVRTIGVPNPLPRRVLPVSPLACAHRVCIKRISAYRSLLTLLSDVLLQRGMSVVGHQQTSRRAKNRQLNPRYQK